MVTRDVLKVLKLQSPPARASLRTFKTSLVPMYHEIHSCSYDLIYLLILSIGPFEVMVNRIVNCDLLIEREFSYCRLITFFIKPWANHDSLTTTTNDNRSRSVPHHLGLTLLIMKLTVRWSRSFCWSIFPNLFSA